MWRDAPPGRSRLRRLHVRVPRERLLDADAVFFGEGRTDRRVPSARGEPEAGGAGKRGRSRHGPGHDADTSGGGREQDPIPVAGYEERPDVGWRLSAGQHRADLSAHISGELGGRVLDGAVLADRAAKAGRDGVRPLLERRRVPADLASDERTRRNGKGRSRDQQHTPSAWLHRCPTRVSIFVVKLS